MLSRLPARQARTATLSITAILLVILVAVLILVPVPYTRLTPGPTTDTLGEANGKSLIVIEGRKTYPDTGMLDLTTVAISNSDHRMTLLEAMSGWLRSGVAIVPRNTIYPDDQSAEDIEERNTQEMVLSQKHATAAALRALDIPITSHVVVAALTEGTPAFGQLEVGDRILKVDNEPIKEPIDVVTQVRTHSPGQKVVFTIDRAGERMTKTLTTAQNPDDGSLPFVGIEPNTDYEFPFSVKISLEDVGGPSAGLMFALGLVERLTVEDITGGRHIAGTGSIADDGTVGKIGGIAMTILGATRGGATGFMVPAEICREAVEGAPGG
ncbi:MAG: YlbL family protein, partial [Sporichthyaceae bacterium]